jgi:hypothetical protein
MLNHAQLFPSSIMFEESPKVCCCTTVEDLLCDTAMMHCSPNGSVPPGFIGMRAPSSPTFPPLPLLPTLAVPPSSL